MLGWGWGLGPCVGVGVGTWDAWVGGQACGGTGEGGSARLGPLSLLITTHCVLRPPPRIHSSTLALSSTVTSLSWQRWDAQQQVHGAHHMIDMDQSGWLQRSRSARAKVLPPPPQPPPSSLGANYRNYGGKTIHTLLGWGKGCSWADPALKAGKSENRSPLFQHNIHSAVEASIGVYRVCLCWWRDLDRVWMQRHSTGIPAWINLV